MEVVFEVDISDPPLTAVYQATLILSVPVSESAGTFTYADTAYEVEADTAIRDAVTAPESDAAAFVTSRQEEPKKAS
jgi:hypothetical protein